jgi:hypothetical protein
MREVAGEVGGEGGDVLHYSTRLRRSPRRRSQSCACAMRAACCGHRCSRRRRHQAARRARLLRAPRADAPRRAIREFYARVVPALWKRTQREGRAGL